MKTSRLTNKVSFFILFVLIVSSLIFVGTTYVIFKDKLIEELTYEAALDIFPYLDDISEAYTEGDTATLQFIYDRLFAENPDMETLVFFDESSKKVIISQGEEVETSFFLNQEIIDSLEEKRFYILYDQSNRVHVFSKLENLNFDEGIYLRIDYSTARTEELATALLKTMLIVILITFIPILVGGSLLVKQSILQPIQEFERVSKKIAKRDYNSKVNVHTKDEFEDFAKIFNNTIETLKAAHVERREIEQAKTKFLSISSHELRSPMTPIKGQIQMLTAGYYGKLTKEQDKSIGVILNNINRLDAILVDILEVSRIEAGRLKFEFVKTDLGIRIRYMIQEIDSYLKEKRISIKFRAYGSLKCKTDPERVVQILKNLIQNAKKFSKDGSHIDLTIKRGSHHLEFSVKDTGIGIAQENIGKVFEPFFQEEQTIYRKYQGNGLGLTIVKGIIEIMNGSIKIDSVRKKGTTITFTLPLKGTEVHKRISLFKRGDK